MLGASVAMFLALALSFAVIEGALPAHWRSGWPPAVGALACALGYWAYGRRVERRDVAELRISRAPAECGQGLGLGVVLGLLSVAPLAALGMYRIDGRGDVHPLVQQIPEMLLVSVMEELLVRGVVFRLAQQAWGSGRALALSTVLFVAAHLFGEISLIGVLVTAAASVAFTAAYLASRRLWLPIGMHFGWNYLFSAVLSVPVSGHPAAGWVHASSSGPQWLTGGAYGIEASSVALLVWAVTAALLLRLAVARGAYSKP
jgi:membrane protease YdiL (CAAX protease family)